MGIFSFFDFKEHRRRKELAAIIHLEAELLAEAREMASIRGLLQRVKAAVQRKDFREAESLLPSLVGEMKRKRVLDRREGIDFKKFDRTLFRDLQEQLRKGAA